MKTFFFDSEFEKGRKFYVHCHVKVISRGPFGGQISDNHRMRLLLIIINNC